MGTVPAIPAGNRSPAGPPLRRVGKSSKKKGEICGVGAVLDLQGPPGCPHAVLHVGSCLVLSPVEAGCCVIPIFGSLPCPCVSGGAVVMPQGTPTSLCPMLSPPHPTSSGGDEDPSKLVRCRGVPAPQTSSGHPKSATPLLCPAWLLRGGTGMLRRCLPGLICGVAQPSRAAQRAAGRELTRGGRRGGCFESLPRSGREALGLPSRAASRQPGSHTLVEDEPSLLACPPPEPGCPRPPLTSVPKHQRGCRCSANQPPPWPPWGPPASLLASREPKRWR